MAHDVYVCYSSTDKTVADLVCRSLEARGIVCWIAPRDVPKGKDWSKFISRAIVGAGVVVVVVSASSMDSGHVVQDLQMAARLGVPVVLLRIEAVPLPEALKDAIETTGSVDATSPPSDGHLGTLAQRVAGLLRQGRGGRAQEQRIARDAERRAAEEPPPAPEPVMTASGHLVFIGAKSEDYGYAARVHGFLVGHGLRVFFSRESLPALGNADYGDQIDEALEEAAHMIVVASSREHVTSEWVKAEWRLFVNEKRAGRKSGNLLTVTAGRMAIRDLPLTLRGYEVVPLTDEGLERLLAFVKDPPRPA